MDLIDKGTSEKEYNTSMSQNYQIGRIIISISTWVVDLWPWINIGLK